MKTKALAPWFGSNRMLAEHVGAALSGCEWVGVPFAGGMSELVHIDARTILVNDLHRHVINLGRVVKDEALRRELFRRLKRTLFHPDELADAQAVCKAVQPNGTADVELACCYFLTCWLGRSHKAGVDDEFNGGLSLRWNSNGGDSAVRYRSAVRGLAAWGKIATRCTFTVEDAFHVLARCEDKSGHGVYCDPPFPGPGYRYRFSCGKSETDQKAWHAKLANAVARFEHSRIVCRFYDHPLVRQLYPTNKWAWRQLRGRTQSNQAATEVLLTNSQVERRLF